MFDKIAVRFVEMQMPYNDCWGHLEFRLKTGNTGTWMCR